MTERKTSMQKFRQSNTRIDYYPYGPALDAITRLHAQHPHFCRREIIDLMVMEGAKKFFPDTSPLSGNFQETNKC